MGDKMTLLSFSITSFLAVMDPNEVIHIVAFPEHVIQLEPPLYGTMCGEICSSEAGWTAWVSDSIEDTMDVTDGMMDRRSTDEVTCPECKRIKEERNKKRDEEWKQYEKEMADADYSIL
jgi:hypothetical protein